MSIFIGVDPGKQGAIVALRDDGKMKVCRLDNSTEPDVWRFLESLAEKASWNKEPVHAVLEQIQPMPSFMSNKDGEQESSGMRGSIASMKIGQSYGLLRGFLVVLSVNYGVRFEEARPQVWQKAMGVSGGDRRKKKVVNKEAAQRLFPTAKVIHVNADAMLIAEYCRRIITSRSGPLPSNLRSSISKG